jgi:hypothetical protein
MKIPKSVSKILENKYVLYFVLFLAAVTIFGYLVVGNITAIITFTLIGYLVYNFNKNMIIVLSVPLILTSILLTGRLIKEGLENNATTAPDSNTTTATPSTVETVSAIATNSPTKSVDKKMEKTGTPNPQSQPQPILQENGGPEAQESMTTIGKKNNRIDYAATVEDAYDDLNKILGGDGIKRLTDDTQKLMGQQMKLAEAMKSMTPLMSQAKELMKGFDMKGLGDITSMAKQFGVSK